MALKETNKISNDISRLQYTSRDYSSIYQDLIDAIPVLTNRWTSREETDPGIVLVKLMSMLGDMLSYNQDKKALEVYPGSVTERKNAAQIFGLVGYDMHWYQSATCIVNFSNSSSLAITIPRFTKFLSLDGRVAYTTTYEIEVSPDQSSVRQAVLVQGIPKTPIKSAQYTVDKNQPWHSIYGYNMFSRDVTDDNCYYLSDKNVDESNITLVDSSGEEWHLVDSVDLQTSAGKFFEFGVDEYDRPYIKLVDYWYKYDITDFKLFYILSDGSEGTLAPNMLKRVDSTVYSIDTVTGNVQNASDNLNLTNYRSTLGYDPETPDEARKESKKYINTIDTLVTLQDFERAVSRMNGVAKVLALDLTNDPNLSTVPEDELAGNLYKVNIYIDRVSDYEDSVVDPDDEFEYQKYLANEDAFKAAILTQLSQYKLMPLNINVDIRNIDRYYWTVKGELYLNEPVDIDTSRELITHINNELKFIYSNSEVDFNTVVKYIDVVNSIIDVDPIINYVDLEQIQIIDKDGNVVPECYVTGRYKEIIPGDPSRLSYNFTLQNVPVRPGSVTIKYDGGNYIIMDNGNGRLIDYQNLLSDRGCSINYTTGEVHMNVNINTVRDIIVTYNKNIITSLYYVNLNTEDFNVTSDSLLQD